MKNNDIFADCCNHVAKWSAALNKNFNVHNIGNDVRTQITCGYIIIHMYLYARSIDSAMRIVRSPCYSHWLYRKQCSTLPKKTSRGGKDKPCVDAVLCTVA